MKLFIPITKVDAVKREVWGRMVQEVEDTAHEIFDYEGSKPYFEAWSEKFSKATDGKSLGNVRAMHQPISAGKVTQMDFLDDELAIDICTKIVDDKEWEKVEEGVYTGFSIGGEYVKRWSDGTCKRYIANPKEVSLVDSPAVPTAMFSMIKADGSIEQRSFKMTTQTKTAAVDVLAEMLNKGEITPERLIELAKADKPAPAAPTPEQMVEFLSKRAGADANVVKSLAGEALAAKYAEAIEADKKAEEAKKAEELKKADDAAAELEKKQEDEAAAKAKAEELAKQEAAKTEVDKHNERIALKARELCKAANGNDGKWQDFVSEAIRELKKADETPAPAPIAAPAKDPVPAAVTDPKPAVEIAKTDAPKLKKGLYDCQRLADILMSLASCASCAQSEADWEGDQSKVPAQLRDAAIALGQALKDMTTEEVDELVSSMGGMGSAVMCMADRVGDLVKTGKLADTLRKAGARHSKIDLERVQTIHKAIVELGAKCEKDDGDVANADAGGQLKKALETMSKVEQLEKIVADLQAEVKKLNDQPLPPRGVLRVVGKDEDGKDPSDPAQKTIVSTPGQHNPEAALALIKQSVVATAGARKL